MNIADILLIVLRRAGQRENDATLRAQIEVEIPFTQLKLEGGVRVGERDSNIFLPWFLVKESTTLTQAVGVETVALPADFLMEYDEEIGPTFFYLANDSRDPWKPLSKASINILRRKWTDTGDAPRGYDLLGNLIYVRPIANIETTFRMMYYGREPELTGAVTSNAWTTEAVDIMVAELLMVAARLTYNDRLQADATSESKAARERLHTFHIARIEAARERYMGEAN